MLKLTLLAGLIALGAPALFAQEAAAQGCCADDKDAKPELPCGEAIMDKAIEAMGGVEAIKKIKSTVMKGTMDPGMGMSLKLTVYAAAPNLTKTEMEIPGMGKMLQGYDGKVAWSYSAMNGPAIMGEKMAEETKEDASFVNRYDWRIQYPTVETKGIESVEGEECYKVIATSKSGKASTHYYSVKTGLLTRMDAQSETPMGVLTVQTVLKDYKEVDGVKFPFKTTQSAMGQVMTMIYTEIKNNVDIPSSTFEPPAEVKALMDK
jgi:outer membrane lipoprotein-sorting protein